MPWSMPKLKRNAAVLRASNPTAGLDLQLKKTNASAPTTRREAMTTGSSNNEEAKQSSALDLRFIKPDSPRQEGIPEPREGLNLRFNNYIPSDAEPSNAHASDKPTVPRPDLVSVSIPIERIQPVDDNTKEKSSQDELTNQCDNNTVAEEENLSDLPFSMPKLERKLRQKNLQRPPEHQAIGPAMGGMAASHVPEPSQSAGLSLPIPGQLEFSKPGKPGFELVKPGLNLNLASNVNLPSAGRPSQTKPAALSLNLCSTRGKTNYEL